MPADRAFALALMTGPFVLAVALAGNDESRVHRESGLIFGKGADTELKLDLAMPAEGDGPFPAIVCIHGGGWWSAGKREDLRKTIEVLAGRGYVAVSIDYRLVPTARFPGPLHDCKAAVRWLRANAPKYRVDPDRIGVVGYATGAHLGCLLGTTGRVVDLEGDGGNARQSSQVQAVVSFFGLTDLTKRTWNEAFEKNVLVPFLGDTFARKPELYRQASPLSFVHAECPPFLFFHGDRDEVIRPSQSRELDEGLRSEGVTTRLEILEGEGHGWTGDKLLVCLTKMIAFLDTHLKKK